MFLLSFGGFPFAFSGLRVWMGETFCGEIGWQEEGWERGVIGAACRGVGCEMGRDGKDKT